MKLSIVTPCLNEEEALPFFYKELSRYIKDIDYELIIVDDGSKDDTVKVALKLKEEDPNIKILSFSRNFGKEAAILAGLRESSGDLVVLIDADLQDPPRLLKEMIKILEDEKYDSVATYRVSRKGEPPIRSFFARLFYRLINKMIDVQIVDGARDYRMMKRPMVDAILKMSEYHRFSKGIFAWVGFETYYLEFENVKRVAGETKWSFWGLFKYAIDGIVAFSTLPLRFATIAGTIVSLFGFLYMVFIALKAIFFGDPVQGYPSLIVIISLLGGIQLLILGIIGEYLARTYMEVKHRPNYIIKKRY